MTDPIRLKLEISYDGTNFVGWAEQPALRTVAGQLSSALRMLLRTEIPLVVAGRTDSGVHATGQVAHIDVPGEALQALTPRGQESADPTTAGVRGLVRRLAGVLPTDVRVRGIGVAAPGFDARFAALRRHYRYRVGTAEWGVDPLRRTDTWSLRRALDVDRMQAAGTALIGLHDFASYCKPREGATTVRELQGLTVSGIDPDTVAVDVTADAFCHSMVRSLVGSLVAVGVGREPVTAPADLLALTARTSQAKIAPALGLTLVGVDYPPDDELAARVLVTRSVRN